jgi:hypothetical protein
MRVFGNFEILPMTWRRRLCGVEGVAALLPLDAAGDVHSL